MARQESAAAAFWNDETRMWLNWEKYTHPVVQLTLLPNKGLLEETVPYYLLGLKPPEQTLGRAGIWKKIAQTMEEAKLTRPRTTLMLHDKDGSDAEPSIQAEEEKGVAAPEAAAAEEAVAEEAVAAESPTQQRKQWPLRLWQKLCPSS